MNKRIFILLLSIAAIGIATVYFIKSKPDGKAILALNHKKGFMEQHLLVNKSMVVIHDVVTVAELREVVPGVLRGLIRRFRRIGFLA